MAVLIHAHVCVKTRFHKAFYGLTVSGHCVQQCVLALSVITPFTRQSQAAGLFLSLCSLWFP